MKKVFFINAIALVFALKINEVTYAQGMRTNGNLRSHVTLEKTAPRAKHFNSTTKSGSLFRNEINIKAIRNFEKTYKNINDTKWCKSPDGEFAVYFVTENISNTIYYNKQGEYEFMIRHYNEERLPRDVRHLVKSNYYDFSIYRVTEITRNGKIAYAIKLEDARSWKTIKVIDGEMEVVDEYRKI